MIALASDHGGYALKEELKTWLEEQQIPWRDFGCFSQESCDYPDFAAAAAQAVASGECEKGVVICTTGIGISIAANKVPGIRCALCRDVLSAQLTRRHNDANMLALAGGFTGPFEAKELLRVFLSTSFEGGRHQRRIEKVARLEKES